LDTNNLRISGGFPQKFVKRPTGHTITLSVVDYEGVLQITDIDLFKKVFQEGIGQGRSFGLGMLLIKKGQ
jgi:CRISPR system Cascade subunit CasE